MTNKRKNVLYTGVTGNLEYRMIVHKQKLNKCFTSRYNVNQLVYWEEYDNPLDAIAREKQIKGWTRAKKERLIRELNPLWKDLSADWH